MTLLSSCFFFFLLFFFSPFPLRSTCADAVVVAVAVAQSSMYFSSAVVVVVLCSFSNLLLPFTHCHCARVNYALPLSVCLSLSVCVCHPLITSKEWQREGQGAAICIALPRKHLCCILRTPREQRLSLSHSLSQSFFTAMNLTLTSPPTSLSASASAPQRWRRCTAAGGTVLCFISLNLCISARACNLPRPLSF